MTTRSNRWGLWWHFLLKHPGVLLAWVWIVIVVLTVSLVPVMFDLDPDAVDLSSRLAPPSAEHWLGTDDLGRDVLTRLIFGGRLSLLAALLAVGIGVVAGTLAGIAAGFFGGWVDSLLSRLADAVMTLPTLILAIAIVAALGPSIVNAMIALGVVYIPRIFRVARGAAMSVSQELYIESARAIGLKSRRILIKYVLPNALTPLLIQAALLMGFALLAEASLSFLGLAAQPPQASWGVMLGRAFQEIRRAPGLLYAPGLAIALSALALNAASEGIRLYVRGKRE